MCLITLYQRIQAIPGSDLGLIELMCRAHYDKSAAPNPSGFLVEFDEFYNM